MKTYIVGNWKLNFTVGEASIYLHKLLKTLPNYRDLEVVVAPSALALQPLSLQVDRHKIKLAAQNAFYRDTGAYTGEISFAQLRGMVDYVIIGHSERRYVLREDDKISEVSDDELSKVIIAYEPVWAISSAKSAKLATPDEVGEVVNLIRKTLIDTYGAKASENVPVLFGGSVNSSNAGAYLTVPGVNGLLMGASSLILNEFVDIIEIAKRVRT